MDADPALETIAHDSEHGRWTLWRRRPGLLLRQHVIEMEGYVEYGGAPVVRRQVPFSGVPLILLLDHHFSLCGEAGEETARLGRSFVAGLAGRPTMVGSPGRAFCMQVNFTPLGARRFLGIDMDEIGGRVEDADAILGLELRRLEDRLAHAVGWLERFNMLERYLAERISQSGIEPSLSAEAYRRLAARGGALGVTGLAQALGVSRKHLGTLFRRDIGMTPKAMARLMRFERAMAGFDGGRVRSLADLAYACGYADQPHFNREFRAMSGLSPGALLRKMLPDGTGIVAPR